MICIFFISGSHFTKDISYNSSWIQELRKHNYVVKNSNQADLNILISDCQKFIELCLQQYSHPTIGILGICSGGYYALSLKRIIPNLQFCIGVAPVINPQFRKQLLQQLPASKLTNNFKEVIKATPKIRKIYNKIDSETLIITGKKDTQVPIEIFQDYQIPNLVILKNMGHSITQQVSPEIMKQVNKFLKAVTQEKII